MQAIVFHGKFNVTLEDLAEPTPAAGEVLIEVAYSAICGSDLHGYLGHSARRNAHVPLVMGHEFTGRIVALGDGVQGLATGDRATVQPAIACGTCPACRAGKSYICPTMKILGIERAGAFTKLVRVPADRVFKLPAGLSALNGALTETLAVEVHVFRHQAPPLPRCCVILGAGAQGLLAVQLARLAGATEIVCTDLMPWRLELARKFGATRTVQVDKEDPVAVVKKLTDNWGADYVVDTAGVEISRQQGIAMLAPGATLTLIGLGKGETLINALPIVGKELCIRGSYAYTDDDFARALELLASGQVAVPEMLQVMPLADGVSAFDRLVNAPTGLTKVVLQVCGE